MPTEPDRRVVVVLPTYNERENLEGIVEAILRHGYRILVVDDASPDGTGELADAIARRASNVDVLHRPEKEGLGPAYAAGFESALGRGAEIVCEMDADFSHDPDDLPRLVDAVRGGADLAIGSRYVPGGGIPDWPPVRRFLSKGGNVYARAMLGLPVRDATAGFRAYKASAIRLLHPETCQAAGYGFQIEMTRRAADAGLRIVEVPITFRDRAAGESKMRGRIVIEAMWLVTRWGVERLLR